MKIGSRSGVELIKIKIILEGRGVIIASLEMDRKDGNELAVGDRDCYGGCCEKNG